MPSGKVRWFDPEKGFGFISQDGGEDVFVRTSALPEGAGTLQPGQRVEFDMVSGRRGPQALRVTSIEEPPTRVRGGRREQGGRPDSGPARRMDAEALHGTIEDMITLLDSRVQPLLRQGRFPERKIGSEMAGILRAVARELDA